MGEQDRRRQTPIQVVEDAMNSVREALGALLEVKDAIAPKEHAAADFQIVVIDYTNWRGERGLRNIIPRSILWASTEWHPEEQWLIDALDVDKGEFRSFAMKDIHSWTPQKKTQDDTRTEAGR